MSFASKLEAVPWSELHHAYGPARDVPELLAALMNPESATAALCEAANKSGRSLLGEVQWILWGNVYHQGTVWQVTASTVPFFAEILRNGPKDRELQRFVICYLHHLAMSDPQYRFPSFIDPEKEFAWIAGMDDPGGPPDYEDEDESALPLCAIWIRNTYEMVERHLDAVVPFANAADGGVAGEAIAMFASFPRCAHLTVPPLEQLVERGGTRAGHAAISLAVLAGAPVRAQVEALVDSPDPLTSVLGACAAVLADPSSVAARTVDRLRAPLAELSEVESPHAMTIQTLLDLCVKRLPTAT